MKVHFTKLLVWALMFILQCLVLSCTQKDHVQKEYRSEILEIKQLTENTFVHTSFLKSKNFGTVPCNGMIVRDQHEVIIVDTPVDDQSSLELINWIEQTLQCQITGVVASHFHVDCLGGLGKFHDKKIPSYGNQKTIELATSKDKVIPKIKLENQQKLVVGNKKLILDFLGEGHTIDNMISYFPSEKVLFGGCLIKKLNAGKGNLADANELEWPNTVRKVKERYSDATTVIPGHGPVGGQDLLDFTINLFEDK